MLQNKPELLLEPSVADALAWLSTAPGLSEGHRQQLACSLRIIAKALGRSPQLLPSDGLGSTDVEIAPHPDGRDGEDSGQS